jgi:hypothetical protein
MNYESIHYLPFTIHYLLFTIYHSLFSIQHSAFSIQHSAFIIQANIAKKDGLFFSDYQQKVKNLFNFLLW